MTVWGLYAECMYFFLSYDLCAWPFVQILFALVELIYKITVHCTIYSPLASYEWQTMSYKYTYNKWTML